MGVASPSALGPAAVSTWVIKAGVHRRNFQSDELYSRPIMCCACVHTELGAHRGIKAGVGEREAHNRLPIEPTAYRIGMALGKGSPGDPSGFGRHGPRGWGRSMRNLLLWLAA